MLTSTQWYGGLAWHAHDLGRPCRVLTSLRGVTHRVLTSQWGATCILIVYLVCITIACLTLVVLRTSCLHANFCAHSHVCCLSASLSPGLCHGRVAWLKISSINSMKHKFTLISHCHAWHSTTAQKHIFVQRHNLTLKYHNFKSIILLEQIYFTKLLTNVLASLSQNFIVKFWLTCSIASQMSTLLTFIWKWPPHLRYALFKSKHSRLQFEQKLWSIN